MAGGTLHVHLRRAKKRIRKRYGSYDSRGQLAGKRHISRRLGGATNRSVTPAMNATLPFYVQSGDQFTASQSLSDASDECDFSG